MRILAAVLLLTAGIAHADEADDARAHYQAAQKHYDKGEYEEAIVGFERAYALKPHANVLYNIGQANERLLDYGKSVSWFERYLKEAPADAEFRGVVENRLRVLRNLPARISISAIPETIHATLVDGDGNQWKKDTPATFKVPAGSYQVYLDFPGWEAERHELRAEIGQPYFYQYRLKRTTSPVTVFSRPKGARVFIDNRLVGETPFTDNVEVGKHQLLLEHPEYPWHREVIDVEPGLPLKREVKLTRPARSGRTELVLASMVYGGAAGSLLVGAVSNFEGLGGIETKLPLLLGTTIGGLGLGFVGSFLATKDGIKIAHSSLIIGGGAWGTAIGGSLALGLQIPPQYVYALTLLGGGIGITSAILVTRYRNISAGDAAIFNSGGLWGTLAGALLAHSIFASPTGSEMGWFMLGGAVLGCTSAGLAAWRLERSRGQVALIDLGGLTGGLIGLGIGFGVGAAAGKGNETQEASRYSLGGIAVGMLAAAILARNYKKDITVEALFRRDENGKWALGLPALRIEPQLTAAGMATTLTIDVIRGKF